MLDTMSIVVRRAELEELQSLSALCLRSKAVWGYDRPFLEACREELLFWPQDLQSTGIAVAETDSGVVGVVQVKVVNAEADLMKLFVEPTQMRSGVGRVLMNWAVERARSLGAIRMFIEADPDAAQFYRNNGAHDVGVVASGSIPGRMLPKLVIDLASCSPTERRGVQ
jgi:GNAT superfamily N-acetyltransferase